MTRWNIAEAKVNLEKIINQVYMGIPHEISSNGKVVCLTTYKKNKQATKLTFKEALLSIPKVITIMVILKELLLNNSYRFRKGFD